MSYLPWVRLDVNIWSHDKTLELLELPKGKEAMCLYVFGLAYCGGNGTDGRIPKGAIPMLSGTRQLADKLVDVGLWRHLEGGAYEVVNYERRQELAEVTERKREGQAKGGRRSACKLHHDPACTCSEGGPIVPRAK